MANITHIRCKGVEGEPEWEDRHLFDEETNEWNKLPFKDYDVYTCNDCGAHSDISPDDIKHHATCTPGDAKKWEAFYTKANEEEEEFDNGANKEEGGE